MARRTIHASLEKDEPMFGLPARALASLVGCGDDARTPLADDDDDDDEAIVDTTPPRRRSGLHVWADHDESRHRVDDNSEADLAGYILEKSTDRGSNWFDLAVRLHRVGVRRRTRGARRLSCRRSTLVGNESGRSHGASHVPAPSGGGPKIPAGLAR